MEDVLDILQLDVDGNRIRTERPLSVAEDAGFVIDARELLDNIGNNFPQFGTLWKNC